VANLWIYWISEFLGAGLAAVLFLVLNGNRLPEAAAASREIAQEQTT
jgi:glycerol uptake facilitator-like aquaporin